MGEAKLRRVQRLAMETKLLQQLAVRLSGAGRRPDRRAGDGRSRPCGRGPGGSGRFPAGIRPAPHHLSDVQPLPVGDRALAAACLRRSRSSCGWSTSGRAARRPCPPAGLGHARRRSRDSAGRSNAPRTAWPALRGRRRSWRRPAAPTCPCRCGGRSRAGRPRRCPTGVPPQWCSSALTSVPSRLPAAGWTTSPAGLSTTSRCSSSNTIVSGMSCGSLCAGSGSGTATRSCSSPRTLVAGIADRRAARVSTAPLRIRAFSRSRDRVGTAAASARSSRQPAWAGSRRTSIV